MNGPYDVVIAGGAVMGSAVAYFLGRLGFPDRIVESRPNRKLVVVR